MSALEDVASEPVDPPFPDLRPLPDAVTAALVEVDASARLVAHLRAVHDVALQIVAGIREVWPTLDLDVESVLLGAATHDIGKALHPDELVGPGNRHEHVGGQLLLDQGFAPEIARFARTHAAWNAADATIEDQFVALADKIWKGRRQEDLEQLLVDRIAAATGGERWEVFGQLDEMLTAAASEADGRLAFQNRYPPERSAASGSPTEAPKRQADTPGRVALRIRDDHRTHRRVGRVARGRVRARHGASPSGRLRGGLRRVTGRRLPAAGGPTGPLPRTYLVAGRQEPFFVMRAPRAPLGRGPRPRRGSTTPRGGRTRCARRAQTWPWRSGTASTAARSGRRSLR